MTQSASTTSGTEQPATTTSTVPETTSTVTATTDAIDQADIYLGTTTEIYRRALPNGDDFVARLSTEPYATVFGLNWTAPTGSATECLGDHAMFFGVPGRVGFWGSAWVASPWFDDTISTQPMVLQSSMSAAENTVPATQYLVVRTHGDAAEIVLSSIAGAELDRSDVINGIAMVVVEPNAQDDSQTVTDLQVTVVAKDGLPSATSRLAPFAPNVPAECGPGEAPQRPLPEPGAQPADSGAATTQIRQRHALLVDRSVPTSRKPADLLDDDMGVQDAIAALDEGQYRDIAASATYSIADLVFTKPDEAWFRYTITTTTTTYRDRFGIAVFDGKVWRITRATICQDLALALAPCLPTPPTIEPPSTPEWEAAWQEWVSRANLYMGSDGCGPLSQC
ncbi:MAG: hypothetical protein ABI706_13695 [Ilumatobacteraceae bacterium]